MAKVRNAKGQIESAYKPEYVQELLDYCNKCLEMEPLKDKDGEFIFTKRGELVYPRGAFPTAAGFAVKIGVNRKTLYNWASERYPEGHEREGDLKRPLWADAYGRLDAYQEAILVPGALNGTFNSHFASFFAVNNIDGYEHHTSATLKAEVEARNTNLNVDYSIDESATEQQAAETYMKLIKGVNAGG